MFGLAKKKPRNLCVAPANSKNNIEEKPALKVTVSNLKENHCDRSTMNKCPHCENMAKNFLYLESLIRNNCDKNPKCNLCQSSLKYLQYVNKNIMQVFGNFDSIVQAARVFSTQVQPIPKYTVKKPQPTTEPLRSEGGAVIKGLKSSKSLKAVKSQKSKKSIKSLKSGKSLTKSKGKSGAGSKSRPIRGKMVLKPKFCTKATRSSKLGKKLGSASQYNSLRSMRSMRSKLSSKAKKNPKRKLRLNHSPVSVNWSLLKRNMPRPTKPLIY